MPPLAVPPAETNNVPPVFPTSIKPPVALAVRVRSPVVTVDPGGVGPDGTETDPSLDIQIAPPLALAMIDLAEVTTGVPLAPMDAAVKVNVLATARPLA